MISISKISKLIWIMSLNFILLKSNFQRIFSWWFIWNRIIWRIWRSWKWIIGGCIIFWRKWIIGGSIIFWRKWIIGGCIFWWRKWLIWFDFVLFISLVLIILFLIFWVINFINNLNIDWFIPLIFTFFFRIIFFWFFTAVLIIH